MSEPIWSTGGVGGESAVTDDLEWAVGVLHAAARDVDAAQLELARRRASLQLDPGVGQAALVAELGWAANPAPALEHHLDDTARRLSAVAAAYIDGERKAQHRVGALTRVRESAEDAVGDAAWVLRVAAAVLVAGSPLGTVASPGTVLPDGAPPTTGTLTRDTAELISRSPQLVGLEAALTAALWLIEHVVSEPWEGTVTATRVSVEPSTSLEDVMHRLYDAEQLNDGGLRIERWTDAAGVTHRVVFIPGTTDWTGWKKNPFDGEADGELQFGIMPDAARAVMAALKTDGAKPGDPVMLTGHSLGGTVAAALAANADCRSQFNVKAVVTAGSPTGNLVLPSSVNALHLEGTRDIVPGLDGKSNPDTPTRVTVHHDARESELPQLKGAAHDIGSAHSLTTYAQTAKLVDDGLSPSTDAWLDAERGFLQPGANVVVTQYTA